jgi:hypothetical protein
VTVFAVTEISGPRWDASRARREQDAWDEHAAFMDGLVEDGFVVLAGPIGEGERVLLIVVAGEEPEVRARFAEDPWLSMEILGIATIEPWTIWLDGRPSTTPR